MQAHRSLPDIQRLSVLIATILLAFVMARFIQLPGMPIGFTLAGITFAAEINTNTFIAIIVAGLTAAGTDILIREHPAFLPNEPTYRHWILPGLSAWVASFPLSFLPLGPLWWGGFTVAGFVLLAVIVAEYICVDEDDLRQPVASAALVAIAFMLFLILVISLRSSGVRLTYFIPALAAVSTLISLRSLDLRLKAGWLGLPALVAVLITVQLAAPLHYLPISSLSLGLALLGAIYALITFISNFHSSGYVSQSIREPLFVLAFIWLLAFFLR